MANTVTRITDLILIRMYVCTEEKIIKIQSKNGVHFYYTNI